MNIHVAAHPTRPATAGKHQPYFGNPPRGDRPATITLPTEPKALAAKLVEDLGSEACSQVVGELRKLLPNPRVNGVRRRPSPQVALVS